MFVDCSILYNNSFFDNNKSVVKQENKRSKGEKKFKKKYSNKVKNSQLDNFYEKINDLDINSFNKKRTHNSNSYSSVNDPSQTEVIATQVLSLQETDCDDVKENLPLKNENITVTPLTKSFSKKNYYSEECSFQDIKQAINSNNLSCVLKEEKIKKYLNGKDIKSGFQPLLFEKQNEMRMLFVEVKEQNYRQLILGEKVGDGAFAIVRRVITSSTVKKTSSKAELVARIHFHKKTPSKKQITLDSDLLKTIKQKLKKPISWSLEDGIYDQNHFPFASFPKKDYDITTPGLDIYITDYLLSIKKVDFKSASKNQVICDLLLAVVRLLKLKLIHGDIKPDNLLFTTDAPHRAMLCDNSGIVDWTPNLRISTFTFAFTHPFTENGAKTYLKDVFSAALTILLLLSVKNFDDSNLIKACEAIVGEKTNKYKNEINLQQIESFFETFHLVDPKCALLLKKMVLLDSYRDLNHLEAWDDVTKEVMDDLRELYSYFNQSPLTPDCDLISLL